MQVRRIADGWLLHDRAARTNDKKGLLTNCCPESSSLCFVSSSRFFLFFLFFLSCFFETCSTGMFLTAGALKSIFLLVCHRLDGTTIERFAMHRSKRLEAKSITDQMIRFRRPDPKRLCTMATSVNMPNFRLFPQLTETLEIGYFNELHNPQNSSCKDILAKQFTENDL